MSIGNFTESLSQAILVGIILAERLGFQALKAKRMSINRTIAAGLRHVLLASSEGHTTRTLPFTRVQHPFT